MSKRIVHHIALRDGAPPLTKPVRPPYAQYLREELVPRFQPLSLDQFLGGPNGILTTAARWSYVLDGEAVNWCIEWEPGLLVVNVTSDSMHWAARRSPNPEFGGRSATAAEIEQYDAWVQSWERQHPFTPPPQYGLVFDAWDDVISQSFGEWQPASESQSQTARKIFDRLDEFAHGMPREMGTYCDRIEAWRRSDFWNMRWEDFD
jgi:hypothetical protein